MLGPTWAYVQLDKLVALQWSGLWDVISLQTLCWEIDDKSRSWNKVIYVIISVYSFQYQFTWEQWLNPTRCKRIVLLPGYVLMATFHYSSKLQTWLSTCVSVSQAWSKVERQLQTCWKPSDDRTRVTCRDWCSRFVTRFSTKKSKACRKPARTCRKPVYG